MCMFFGCAMPGRCSAPTAGTPPRLCGGRGLRFGDAKAIGMGHGGAQRCCALLARAPRARQTRWMNLRVVDKKEADGTAGRMGPLSRVGSGRKTVCPWQCYFRSAAAWRVARLHSELMQQASRSVSDWLSEHRSLPVQSVAILAPRGLTQAIHVSSRLFSGVRSGAVRSSPGLLGPVRQDG